MNMQAETMRVLLVDDEALALDRLCVLFGDIDGVEVIGHAQDGEQAVARARELKPDLVILDIQMPGRNGLWAAGEISREGDAEVVFITAHEHFAADAFDLDAADYILKPVRFDRLRQATERARRRRRLARDAERAGILAGELAALKAHRSAAGDPEIWVPARGGQQRVPLEAIDWIEAAGDYVLLHTELRSHMLRITMAMLAGKLVGTPLIRVHRSAFVRPDRVAEVKRAPRLLTLVLVDGTSVQVGPSYAAAVEAALGIG